MLITAPGPWPSTATLEFLTSILAVGSLTTTVLESLTIVLGSLTVIGPLITVGLPLMVAFRPLTEVFGPLTAMFGPLTPFEPLPTVDERLTPFKPLPIVAPLTTLEPLTAALGSLKTIDRGLTTAHGLIYPHQPHKATHRRHHLGQFSNHIQNVLLLRGHSYIPRTATRMYFNMYRRTSKVCPTLMVPSCTNLSNLVLTK